LAFIAFYSHRFGTLIKGNVYTLARHGEIDWDTMGKTHISKHDFEEAMRTNASLTDIDKVAEAYLERSGDVSIIPKRSQPHVVEVEVHEGVQRIRIELGVVMQM
jgi:uncharacterized membrane protein YcaP (DUF421 family)